MVSDAGVEESEVKKTPDLGKSVLHLVELDSTVPFPSEIRAAAKALITDNGLDKSSQLEITNPEAKEFPDMRVPEHRLKIVGVDARVIPSRFFSQLLNK